MSEAQMLYVGAIIKPLQPKEFHHGDCIGADEEMHDLIRGLSPGTRIHIHPPEITTYRAWCKGDVTYTPAPYLMRNQSIVRASQYMIATPHQRTEQLRSGTWSTVRYALKKGIPTLVVTPEIEDVVWPDP